MKDKKIKKNAAVRPEEQYNGGALIAVKNLHKTFNEKLHVLKGIDMEINKGEKIVLIGPSGSGKSTFLRCLNMLEVPTEGYVWFKKQLVNGRDPDITGYVRTWVWCSSTSTCSLTRLLWRISLLLL